MDLCCANLLLVAILIVGTIVPHGVPRPVENKIIWQPEAAKAVVDTESLPGAFNNWRPTLLIVSP